LLVVPLAVDLLALPVLRLLDARLFLPGHFAVGERLVLQLLHPRLAFFEARRFLLGELARLLAFLDTVFLALLPLVDAPGAVGLRGRGKREDCYRGID
jgi:hypothetical protein